MLEHDSPPLADKIAEVLQSLIDGTMTRESAARWASRWAFERPDDIRSVRHLRALERIASADLSSLDRPYLYGKEDFTVWLSDLGAK